MILTDRDLKRLGEVHPDLAKVIKRAAENFNGVFMVVEGLRAPERQKELVAKKLSKTLNSKHLEQNDGFAHAVDLVSLTRVPSGKLEADWGRPKAREVAYAVKKAAEELNVDITWGGDWKSFKDGPHFQIEV